MDLMKRITNKQKWFCSQMTEHLRSNDRQFTAYFTFFFWVLLVTDFKYSLSQK